MYAPHLGSPHAPLCSQLATALQLVASALDLVNLEIERQPDVQPTADKLREAIKELADLMQPQRRADLVSVVPRMPPRA